MIPFNVPPFLGTETDYIVEAIKNQKICGDGPFTKKCHQWLEEKTGTAKALLTTSCTHSLEMAALLLDIKPGDEVILPSFTFCSTADAFALRGAKLVFVDIRPDTMNIDEKLIEDAITEKTKAIVPVHYAGVACEMDAIMDIAKRHGLKVVEDAAQAVMSEYKGQALGTIGDFGCYSFHETKNYSMGEGGALLIKDGGLTADAEIIREKGTNRSVFLRGQIDKYTWVNHGSSYLPSDMNAAYLWAQLQQADMIALGKALEGEKHHAENKFNEIRAQLAEMKDKWTQNVKTQLQNVSEDFMQEQRIQINSIEREKDAVRYAEEVLPLALQRHWKQWLEYRQDQLLSMVNNDLQKLAQTYCDAFSERQIFFDLCQRAQVQVTEQNPVYLEGREEIEHVEKIGQVGTAVVIGGMALLSGFALAAIPLVAFGGKNLGSFVTQKFYVDEKLREQQTQLKNELPRLLDDTSLLIERALLKEFERTADKMEMTLHHDFHFFQ